MKSKRLIFIILIFSLTITACSLDSLRTESDQNERPAGEYPGPEFDVPEAPESMYPSIQDGSEVSWNQAVQIIMNNEVSKVVQTQDLKVILTLRDGRNLITFQTVNDEILQIIESCGEICADITVTTE